LRITRYPSLTSDQFFGCVAAFVDALTGELNAAAGALRRLEGQHKGAAFAYEMALDHHRYGALIVVDRWVTLTATFGPHLALPRCASIVQLAGDRGRAAEEVLGRTNQVIDAAESYAGELVEACVAAWQSLYVTFGEERRETEQTGRLGPMLPEEYREARRVFAEDLAVR
jgi:hypothetical protein